MSRVESSKIKDFTDLDAWKRSKQLGVAVYSQTKSFPATEVYSLTNQLRRAAVSVSSNVAEGFGRRSGADKIRFYNMAQTSVDEVRSQLYLALELEYLDEQELNNLQSIAVEVRKLISGLIRFLEKRNV